MPTPRGLRGDRPVNSREDQDQAAVSVARCAEKAELIAF